MKKTRSNMSADFIFSVKDNPDLYKAHVRLGIDSPDIDLIKKDELLLKLNNDEVPTSRTFLFSGYKVLSYIKKPNGDICGEVSLKVARRLIRGFRYIQINYNAELLNCYEVRMGKEGIFVCIYLDDRQVAMIEKCMAKQDDKDFYKIYVKDDKYVELVCIYAVYYDYLAWENKSEFKTKSNGEDYAYTQNKELKSKYNPRFKEECKETVQLKY